jgi:hypothetical protein
VFGIAGVSELGVVARQARLAGGQLLPKMRRGFSTLAKPAKAHVDAAIEAKMPKSGGYAGVLVKATRVRIATDVGFTTAGVTIKTYADGQQRRRDVPSLNRGRLRKKVYGNPNVWVTQRVPAGFWDDAMDHTSDDAHARVREVLDETIRTLKGG